MITRAFVGLRERCSSRPGFRSSVRPTIAPAESRPAQTLNPEAILLDIMLPDGSGLDLAATLAAKSDSRASVVLMSSRSAADHGAALTETPAHGFIAKADLNVQDIRRARRPTRTRYPDVIAVATASLTRVVIADDMALLRQGIARLLTDAGMEISGEAGDALELMRLVEAEQPDVAIVDIRMPPTHTDEGLVAATMIRQRYPSTGVLVLSQYVDSAYVLQLLEGNEQGCGYLLKDRVLNATELISAVQRIAAGEVVVDRELVDTLLRRRREPNQLDELTEREREVIALMAEGLTDRGIAERLWITPATVETHVRHILQSFLPGGAANNRRVHAVLTYLRT